MKTILKNIKYLLFAAFGFLFSLPVYAGSFQEGLGQAAVETGHVGTSPSFFTPDNLPEAIGKFIKIFYIWIIGVAFLILIIYAGIIWMNARGDEAKIEKAKTILKNAIIGIIVAMMAYGLGWLVFTVSGLIHEVNSFPTP